MARIRSFYDTFTEPGGADMVTQQGIALDRNKGGVLPLDKYLTASLELRDGSKNVAIVAAARTERKVSWVADEPVEQPQAFAATAPVKHQGAMASR